MRFFLQLQCVLMLLNFGAALTEEQLSKVLAALPQVDDAVVRSCPNLFWVLCLDLTAPFRLILMWPHHEGSAMCVVTQSLKGSACLCQCRLL